MVAAWPRRVPLCPVQVAQQAPGHSGMGRSLARCEQAMSEPLAFARVLTSDAYAGAGVAALVRRCRRGHTLWVCRRSARGERGGFGALTAAGW